MRLLSVSTMARGLYATSTKWLKILKEMAPHTKRIEPEHRRLEIGFTWISSMSQKSHINTEARLLQLWYAFEILGCRRVEFKADAQNIKSRDAILRPSAKEEGYFRKHMIYSNGRNRDSIYFSIVDDEWPTAKVILLSRLGYDVRPRFSESSAHREDFNRR